MSILVICTVTEKARGCSVAAASSLASLYSMLPVVYASDRTKYGGPFEQKLELNDV